jgi:hypothetical protein
VTFLKRRFVNSQGVWLCPLNIDSIERVFNYSKIDGKDVDAWVVQLQEGLIEASLHGNEYFNEFTKKLRATINNKKRSIDRELRLRAYDICMRSHSAVWSDVLIRFGVGAQSMLVYNCKSLCILYCFICFMFITAFQFSSQSFP